MTMARNAAMTAAGLAAMGSAMTAAVVIWQLLTRPVEAVAAVGSDELEGLAMLVLSTLHGLVMRLLDVL
jgi:hypothetical protein